VPTDTANYNTLTGLAAGNFVIQKATPTITWAGPADIIYGTALSATQLNATASVGGSFVYTPASGTVLNAGNGQALQVNFTPTDTGNYNAANKTVHINVLKANPVITWSNPADIVYGVTLSGTQLNATASVPGSFVYTPAIGVALLVGNHQALKVDFTPADSLNYAIVAKTVYINVVGWTENGFFSPVDMTSENATSKIWNTVKGGSTVPLKFEIFAGSNEQTNISAVKSLSAKGIACTIGADAAITLDELATSGNTALRFDSAGGFFITNWQTPKQANQCYEVIMTALDGSTISRAYFKTK